MPLTFDAIRERYVLGLVCLDKWVRILALHVIVLYQELHMQILGPDTTPPRCPWPSRCPPEPPRRATTTPGTTWPLSPLGVVSLLSHSRFFHHPITRESAVKRMCAPSHPKL